MFVTSLAYQVGIGLVTIGDFSDAETFQDADERYQARVTPYNSISHSVT